jgi:hypothetical protein
MWLPSQNRWTLIDFGCVAEIGSEARMGFSIPYAAPEIVTAVFREHRLTMIANTALDAWSVGILAVELFGGKPALRIIEGRDKVCIACVPVSSVESYGICRERGFAERGAQSTWYSMMQCLTASRNEFKFPSKNAYT